MNPPSVLGIVPHWVLSAPPLPAYTPLGAADPPAHPSASHKRPLFPSGGSFRLPEITRLIHSRDPPPLYSFTVSEPRQTAHTAADLTERHYILLPLTFHLLGSELNPTLCCLVPFYLKGETLRPAPTRAWWMLASTAPFDSHLHQEVLQLQELRLCRSHHQDPGSRRSAHINAAGFIPKASADVTVLHVKRRNQTSTHWSSIHGGVLSSVALKTQRRCSDEDNYSF